MLVVGERPASGQAQMDMLVDLYRLILTYASCWQSIETPSRHDAERSCVSMCMLAVYDVAVRGGPESPRWCPRCLERTVGTL